MAALLLYVDKEVTKETLNQLLKACMFGISEPIMFKLATWTSEDRGYFQSKIHVIL